MAKIKDVINAIEKYAPLCLQGDFDNCGLKIGDVERELTGVLVTLDTNVDVVKEAVAKNCNLIVEHHPLIFRAIKKIDLRLPQMQAVSYAVKNDVAIYSAHTNVDFCDGGLNDYVAEQIGLINIEKAGGADAPRIGDLPRETTLADFAERMKKLFRDENLSTIGDAGKTIKRVAIVNGGGGSHEDDLLSAIEYGADVFITGDVKYSVARLAKDANYAIIQIGHYNTEQGFMPLMAKILSSEINKNYIHQATSLLNPYN